MTERIQITTSDGLTLEARWDSPEDPTHTTVLCHPHPLQGGSMMAPLMIAITQKLVERGHSVLRFNFRGTGDSQGEHDNGVGELLDLDAAMAEAETRSSDVGLAGWSFGAAVALNWLIERDSRIPFAGVAPATQLLDSAPPPGPRRIILGSREQVIDPDALKAYAIENRIDLVITPGDHFFHGRGKKIGDLVGEALESG